MSGWWCPTGHGGHGEIIIYSAALLLAHETVICPSSPLKTNMHGIDSTMVVESTLWLLSFDHYVQHVMRSLDTKLERECSRSHVLPRGWLHYWIVVHEVPTVPGLHVRSKTGAVIHCRGGEVVFIGVAKSNAGFPFHQVALSLMLGQSTASKSLFACAKCCVFMCLNFRHRTSCTSLKPARWLSPEMFLMGCLFYGT